VNISSTANISNVLLDFGDGTIQPLGAISGATPVSHTYSEAGSYIVRATATDAGGCSEQVASAVTILPGQPPAVTLTVSNTNPSVGESVIVTATVSGNTSTIIRYEWNFGSGAVPPSVNTASNRQSVFWTTSGTKGITVTVVQASGPSGDGATAVVVKP
jgi:PKD repeat protein